MSDRYMYMYTEGNRKIHHHAAVSIHITDQICIELQIFIYGKHWEINLYFQWIKPIFKG